MTGEPSPFSRIRMPDPLPDEPEPDVVGHGLQSFMLLVGLAIGGWLLLVALAACGVQVWRWLR